MARNHIVNYIREDGTREGVGMDHIYLEDIDLDNSDIVGLEVLTPNTMYIMEIHETGMDLTDPFEEPYERRKEFKLVKGGR